MLEDSNVRKVEESNPDFICITEAWLDNTIPDNFLCLRDYLVCRCDRANGNNAHDGVFIDFKTHLNLVLVEYNSVHEVVYVKIAITKL